jgi:hypothetical protein
MNRITRRLSPSLLVAMVALFVALAGTAAAAVIIDSPDQIKDGVVTGPKLATDAVKSSTVLDHTIAQRDQVNPVLTVNVAKNGTRRFGNPAQISHVAGSNRYDVTFLSPRVPPVGLDQCGFTATADFDFDQSSDHRLVRAYTNHAQTSGNVQVFTFEERFDPNTNKVLEAPTEAAFNLMGGC